MYKATSSQVVTCFEHQRLTCEDFIYASDFAYLLEQELPCFQVAVKQGLVYLQVKQYLAQIILPSGVTLEILPKVNAAPLASKQSPLQGSTQLKNQQYNIQFTRKWVGQMLVDIAQYDLQKIIPAISSTGSPTQPPQIHTLRSPDISYFGNSSDGDYENLDYEYLHEPWYTWLLQLASKKISAAEGLLPTQYLTRSNNHPQVKGKLNLSEQLKSNWHRPHYLYSEQSVFDTDDTLKQFLATGWHQLQRLQHHNAAQLTSSLFIGVTVLPINHWQSTYQKLQKHQKKWHTQFSAAQLIRLNEAVEWCWWVLQHILAPTNNVETGKQAVHSTNSSPCPAMMINMNHAFEVWVLSRLTIWVEQTLPMSQLMASPSFEWLKRDDGISNESILIQKLIPDACIQSASGKITHVIDVKYKTIDTVQDIYSSDWQQLYVYQQHLKAESAWLVYPMTTHFFQQVRVSSEQSNGKMYAKSFNLQQRMVYCPKSLETIGL